MPLLDEDHVLKILSTKNKAKKVKTDGCSRKKKSCVFKRSVARRKNVSTNEKLDIVSSNSDDDLVEARRSWDLDKQISLHAENDDEVIVILLAKAGKAKGVDLEHYKTKRGRGRKKTRGNQGR